MMSMDNGRQEQVSVAVPERSEGTATEARRPDPEVPEKGEAPAVLTMSNMSMNLLPVRRTGTEPFGVRSCQYLCVNCPFNAYIKDCPHSFYSLDLTYRRSQR